MPFRFASQTSIQRTDNSCGNGGPNKAGLAPQCSFVSTQPIYTLMRKRTMYTKLKQPAAYRNLSLWPCGTA